MLSLGTTVPELEQKPFENGLGAARAALRRDARSAVGTRALSQSAAPRERVPTHRLETTEACSQVSTP